MLKEKMRRERVGIGEHDENAVRRAGRYLLEAVEDAVLFLFRICEGERTHLDSWKGRGPRRDRGGVLHFARPANHSAGNAAEKRSTAKTGHRALDDGLELILELGRDELLKVLGRLSAGTSSP